MKAKKITLLKSAPYILSLFINGSMIAAATLPSPFSSITNAAAAVVITTQPQSQTVCAGSSATFTVATDGSSQPTYLWKKNGSPINDNANISGTNTATLTIQSVTAETAGAYACYITDISGSLLSDTAYLTAANTTAGTVTANDIVCPNGTATVGITGASGDIQWQQSASGVDNWVNVTGGSGATTANYTSGSLSESIYYRAAVNNPTCGTIYSDVIAVTVTETYVWTGSVNRDWNNTGNWACNVVPTLSENVVISGLAGNKPVVSNGTAYAKTLMVEDGASLTVNTGRTLQVAGSIYVTTQGALTVQNNGAILQNNNSNNAGEITLIKNNNPLYRLDYTMWSSPVLGQQLQAFSPQTATGRFYEYKYDFDPALNNGAGGYREVYVTVDPANTYFDAAKGYLIRMPNSDVTPGYNNGSASLAFTGVFKGTPHNGDVTRAASVQGDRYTAVGNPYPSPINVADFLARNANVLQQNSAIYLWRKKNNRNVTSYATLTLAGYVANNVQGGGIDQGGYFLGESTDWVLSQGQGFLVRTSQTPSATNITFTNGMRRPAALDGRQPFFRTAQSSASRLWLNITSGESNFAQTAVAYIDGATLDMDYGYDGEQLNDSAELSIYSLAANNNLAIQARPAFTDTDNVSLGFIAANAGTYTIAIDHTDGVFTQGQNIYLKDNLLGTTNDLANAYSFTTEAGTFNNRFEIVYSTSALGTDTPVLNANNVIVFKENASTISINTGTVEMTGVNIYDVRGRMLYSQEGINTTKTNVTGLQAQQEVLIVEINTVNGKVSKKIVF